MNLVGKAEYKFSKYIYSEERPIELLGIYFGVSMDNTKALKVLLIYCDWSREMSMLTAK